MLIKQVSEIYSRVQLQCLMLIWLVVYYGEIVVNIGCATFTLLIEYEGRGLGAEYRYFSQLQVSLY